MGTDAWSRMVSQEPKNASDVQLRGMHPQQMLCSSRSKVNEWICCAWACPGLPSANVTDLGGGTDTAVGLRWGASTGGLMATGVTSILSSLMGLWVGAAGFPMALPDIHPGLRQWEGQDRLKLRAASLSALRVRLGWRTGSLLHVPPAHTLPAPSRSPSCPCLLPADRGTQCLGFSLLGPQSPTRAEGRTVIFTVMGCTLEEGIASGHPPRLEL